MELVAIQLARVAAFLDILSLDPKGSVTAPEGLRGFGKRYGFEIVPQSPNDIDFQKGVRFAAGHFEDIAIDQIQLFGNGVAIDTRSSTDNCLIILDDLLTRALETSGARIAIGRRHFVSQIVFRSQCHLSLLHPLLQPIADRLTESVSRDLNHPIRFEPNALLIGADLTQLKITPSAFTFERRVEIPFNEDTYFSSAPLGTADHLRLIEEVEAALQ